MTHISIVHRVAHWAIGTSVTHCGCAERHQGRVTCNRACREPFPLSLPSIHEGNIGSCSAIGGGDFCNYFSDVCVGRGAFFTLSFPVPMEGIT